MDLVGPILGFADNIFNGDKKVAISENQKAIAEANARAAEANAAAAVKKDDQTQILLYGGLAIGVLVVGAVLFKVLAK